MADTIENDVILALSDLIDRTIAMENEMRSGSTSPPTDLPEMTGKQGPNLEFFSEMLGVASTQFCASQLSMGPQTQYRASQLFLNSTMKIPLNSPLKSQFPMETPIQFGPTQMPFGPMPLFLKSPVNSPMKFSPYSPLTPQLAVETPTRMEFFATPFQKSPMASPAKAPANSQPKVPLSSPVKSPWKPMLNSTRKSPPRSSVTFQSFQSKSPVAKPSQDNVFCPPCSVGAYQTAPLYTRSRRSFRIGLSRTAKRTLPFDAVTKED